MPSPKTKAFDFIPTELKQRKQWIVWRKVLGANGYTKPPFQARNPAINASIIAPSTWDHFDACIKSIEEHPALDLGIGYVFTEDDPYSGIDIDAKWAFDDSFSVERRKRLEEKIKTLNTYIERSPSGEGLHIIVRGRVRAGRRDPSVGTESYSQGRYFTFTGNVVNGVYQITDQQAFLDWLDVELDAGARMTGATANVNSKPQDEPGLRKVDLSDDELIARCVERDGQFGLKLAGKLKAGQGDWSETFYYVLKGLDYFSGNVDQVERLLLASQLVQNAGPSASGEPRIKKAQRTLIVTYHRVREQNTQELLMTAHGRDLAEGMFAAQRERAQEAADNIRQAEAALDELSKGSTTLLQAFPQLDATHLSLTLPPGPVGEYVQATMDAMHHPFAKYAVPATLAALSGIVGRGYKLDPTGDGVNVNFILAASSGTGKTQTQSAWRGFISRARDEIPNDISGQSKSRIIQGSASSIQGIFEEFMSTPSAAWFVDECAAMLKAMSDPRSPVDHHLRDAYNQLFDASSVYDEFSLPKSAASRKADLKPIPNLSISTFWMTTDAKFDVVSGDVFDGFLSRVVVVRHHGMGGELVTGRTVNKSLPEHLHKALITRMVEANRLDQEYMIDAIRTKKRVHAVLTKEIQELSFEMMQVIESLKRKVFANELPGGYLAVTRVPVNALRIAAVLAIYRQPYAPQVNVDEYKWAFGYVLQALAGLMTSIDKGEVGEAASNESLAVIRAFKHFLKSKDFKGLSGVPHGIIRDWVSRRKPFAGKPDATKLVLQTIEMMVKDGQLERQLRPTGRRGRPTTVLCPTQDEVWL